MADITYAGNKVKIDIAIALQQLEGEVDALINTLALEATKLTRGGISRREAVRTVLADVTAETGLYQAFQNKQKKIIRTMENQLVARPIEDWAGQNPGLKFKWVLAIAEHCPDCLRASRMPARTVAEWRQLGFGLPRQGLTECSYGCKCNLIPEGN